MISLPSHVWTVLLQEQGQEQQQAQEQEQSQEQEQEQQDLKVMICSVHVQTRYILAVVLTNMFYFSFLWRTFLVLHAEGFIRNGKLNITLFGQLFWIISVAFMTIAYSVFPGSMFITGSFPHQSIICLLGSLDDKTGSDRPKIIGVILVSCLNQTFFVLYFSWKTKRLLKTFGPNKKLTCIGKYRRNAINYMESAVLSVAWNIFNILDVSLVAVCKYFNLGRNIVFFVDRFMWVVLLEIFTIFIICKISCREMPCHSEPPKPSQFYVHSPLVLVPRRPPDPLIPFLLAPTRSKGKGRGKNRNMYQVGIKRQTHLLSSQHSKCLPPVD
jgi:hypothetical protein